MQSTSENAHLLGEYRRNHTRGDHGQRCDRSKAWSQFERRTVAILHLTLLNYGAHRCILVSISSGVRCGLNEQSLHSSTDESMHGMRPCKDARRALTHTTYTIGTYNCSQLWDLWSAPRLLLTRIPFSHGSVHQQAQRWYLSKYVKTVW